VKELYVCISLSSDTETYLQFAEFFIQSDPKIEKNPPKMSPLATVNPVSEKVHMYDSFVFITYICILCKSNNWYFKKSNTLTVFCVKVITVHI
jgi:hypothetical protein